MIYRTKLSHKLLHQRDKVTVLKTPVVDLECFPSASGDDSMMEEAAPTALDRFRPVANNSEVEKGTSVHVMLH